MALTLAAHLYNRTGQAATETNVAYRFPKEGGEERHVHEHEHEQHAMCN